MSRRTSLFEEVMRLPWPVGVGLAAFCVTAVQAYLWMGPEATAMHGIGRLPRTLIQWFGYGFAFLFLLGAFLSFLVQIIHGKRFRSTQSLADIRSLSWKQFESFVGDLFRQEGYFVVKTPEGPDNGVDLVLRKGGEKTYVQCKHWKTNQVGVEKVRELLGSMTAGGAQNGILVATGQFTTPARQFASECGIKLIDGEGLAELIGDLTDEQNAFSSKFETDKYPTCPICSSPMVKRVARKGANAGNSFWGCSKFPQCRGIMR
jgi:restriction system protein